MNIGDGQAIPDIHIGRVYDRRDPESDLHYETFGRLAAFFGRNTPPHRHYCFFQLHVLVRGAVRLNLDGEMYLAQAPLFMFTPPTIPHGFYSDEDTDGHVLTVRQEAVREWARALPGNAQDTLLRTPACIEREEATAAEFDALIAALELLQREAGQDRPGHDAALLALGQYAFIQVARVLARAGEPAVRRGERAEDLRLFLKFCDLVEEHFREHLTLPDYAERLAITEARLNDICRRISARPSKEIVHERLLQEARRLLRYSAVPVTEIGYQLGFADPAYFSRFFAKRAGMPPTQFRQMHQG